MRNWPFLGKFSADIGGGGKSRFRPPPLKREWGAVTRPIFGRGGDPTSVEILSKISKFVEILFCQK